jgi:hypothetical protein
MTYVRVGKQVLEFNGKNNRKNYGENNHKSHSTEETEQTGARVEEHHAPPSILLKIVDRVLQPLSRSISKYDKHREQGSFDSSGISLASVFGKDGYCLSISVFFGRSSRVIHLVNMGDGPAFKVVRYDHQDKK